MTDWSVPFPETKIRSTKFTSSSKLRMTFLKDDKVQIVQIWVIARIALPFPSSQAGDDFNGKSKTDLGTKLIGSSQFGHAADAASISRIIVATANFSSLANQSAVLPHTYVYHGKYLCKEDIAMYNIIV